MRIDEMALAAFAFCAAALIVIGVTPGESRAAGYAQPRVTMPLSGYWEFLPEHENEELQRGDSYSWGKILVPALWRNAENIDPKFAGTDKKPGSKERLAEIPYCWYRRKFQVDAGLKGLSCILRIVDVRWSAEVWLNGVRLGNHVGAYRPVDFDATSAVRPGEENVIVIKQGGGRTIPTYEDGTPKILFGNKGWARGASGIMGDIDLRFFRQIEVSRVKIDPNIHSRSCQLAIRLTNHSSEPRAVSVEMRVYERKSGRAASETYHASANIPPNGVLTRITTNDTITIDKPRLWSPESPFLYCLEIVVKDKDGQVCDQLRENFGMREFTAKNGGFYLNGKRIFLRGATDLAITGFPSWGASPSMMTDPKWIKTYLVDNARGMNANVFRTHMGPWYKTYYDIADEYGTMLISEFPNWPAEGGAEYYHRPGFVDVLHTECGEIAASLWNHPSIIIWAACNEPFGPFEEDEKEFLVPFFRKMDPTRPIMQAGVVGEDIADQHNYDGFWTGTLGDHIYRAEWLKSHYPDRPLCDTEYLETAVRGFSNPDFGRAQKWMGYNVTLERAEFTHALFAMEETEVKRRLQFDGLLPFWYGMFMSKGKTLGEQKWATYYALKNSMAPVAVSVGVIDRHFAAGTDLKLPVWTMNDLSKAARGKVQVYIVSEDPPYVYVGPPANPIFSKSLDLEIPAYSATPHEVVVPLPEQEGSYWLYATLKVKGRETVISKHPIHVLNRAKSLVRAKGAKIAVVEQGSALQDWAKAAGIDVRPVDDFGCGTLVIGREALSAEAASPRFAKITEWVSSGGRLVILDQTSWPEGLFGLQVEKAQSGVSYLFKEKGHENDAVWDSISDSYLENWNGSGTEGLTYRFKNPVTAGVLAIGSAGQEGLNSRGLVRVKSGAGEVLACQIRIAERLDASAPTFDPVAERLMANLITSTPQ
jgi:hypothetical protein